MKIRKNLTILFSFILLFSGCKARVNNSADKINVVCSIFPEYDWTRCIINSHNDKVILSMIIKNGIDMHSFTPSDADFNQLSTARLIIYTGGESEQWIKDFIASNDIPSSRTLNLMEILPPEKIHAAENDEHIWLSVQNAKILCQAISNALCQLDAQNAPDYIKNCQNYLEQLDLLDQQFQFAADNATQRTYIFTDRFPFRHLTNDYELSYISAFDGCTSETQVDEQTIQFLGKKLNELDARYLYSIETSDEKTYKAITSAARNYDAETIRLDSMQSSTLRSAIGGKTYINTMQKNLQELEKGLR